MPPAEPEKTSQCTRCGTYQPGQQVADLCASCLLESVLQAETADLTENRPPRARQSVEESVQPRLFGAYELIEIIGRGGMGIVYKARQTKLNRVVALKMVQHWQDASSDTMARFSLEAEAAAKLDHQNIVPTYEIGEIDGQPYFSMKLVPGANLATLRPQLGLKRKDSGIPEKLDRRRERERQVRIAILIGKVARAIHYAHANGVIHRDLKPSNILVDHEDEPHVTDFGLAKLLDQESGLTRTHELLGTPAYMAPEQASGNSISPAVDIYSLGAILYELLTGAPPFHGKTPLETLRRATDEEPVSPVTMNRGADAELTAICLKCLEKNRMQRYDSAQALAEDLGRWVRREPIVAKPANAATRAIRWTRRNRLGATLIVTLCVALIGALVLLRMVSAEKNKNLSALREVQDAGEVNAQLLTVTVSLLKEQFEGLWLNSDQRVLHISSEELAALSAEPLPRVEDKTTIERFTFGLAANESPISDASKHAHLLRYLQARLSERRGKPVRIDLKIFKFKEDRVAALTKGDVDFAKIGGILYLRTKKEHPALRAIVIAETRLKTAVFFTRTNSGIQSLGDLRGRSVAFGDAVSGLTFWAQVKLADAGITGSDLKEYVCLNSRTEFEEEVHEIGYDQALNSRGGWLHSTADVIDEVVEGRFDAGITSERAFEKHKHRGLIRLPNSEFDRGFNNPIVFGKNVTDSVAQEFQEVFTSLQGEAFLQLIPGRPSGFSAVDSKFYTFEEEAIARMEGLYPPKSGNDAASGTNGVASSNPI